MKTALKIVFLITPLALLLNSSVALASLKKNEFRKTVSAAQMTCPDLDCSNSPIQIRNLDPAKIKLLGKDIHLQLKNAAWNLSQIWADTILEGDYYADHQVDLNLVQEIVDSEGERVGYRITYSSEAWMTADCAFDGETPETLEDCLKGSIQESAFVSLSFSEYFRDPRAMAEFIE